MGRERVGYLGPEGTFTHSAALALCPEAELVPSATQGEALRGLEDGRYDAVVVPVDNSVHGVVVPTLDAVLGSRDAVIVDDTTVGVSFDALVRPGGTQPVCVVSHPHALAQCSGFVRRLGLPTRSSASTAEACRSLDDGEVALGPSLCAGLYGLEVLESAVEDGSGARTQFAKLVRGTSAGYPARAGGVTLLAVLPLHNEPGALLRVLQPLERAGLDLVNLVTRPVAESDSEFIFLLYVQGLAPTGDHASVVEEIRRVSSRCVLLGRLSGPVKHASPLSRAVPARLAHDV